jgi:hypothetical protein
LIQPVNLPGKCASCGTGVFGHDKRFAPNFVAVDFRMADFSTATISFCDTCSIKISKDDFPEIEEMIRRGWIVACLISQVARHEPFLATGVREQAATDWDAFAREHLPWDAFAREHLPLTGAAKVSLDKQRSPHIRFNEKGQGIKWSTRMPFPILAAVRWRVPGDGGAGLRLITRNEIEQRVKDRDNGQ